MEINNLKVNELDPFFTAEKWNESVSFIKTFQSLVYSILGHKFKGVYDPTLEYNIHDYIWFSGKCYLIKGVNNRSVLKTITKANQKSAHLVDNSFLSINNGKLYSINGNFEKKLCDLEIDDFVYLEHKEFIIAKSGTKLVKIYLNGKYEYMNSVFEKDIRGFCIDDFGIYCITNNEILFGEIKSDEETVYETLFTANDSFIDVATYDKYIVVLTRDKIIVLNKVDSSDRIFEVDIKKPEKAKITSSSQNEFYIFDGDNTIFSIFISEDTVKISHLLKKPEFNNLVSLKSTEGNITVTTNEHITSFVASKYNITEVDPRMLIVSKSILPILNSSFAVDFSKSELGSEFNKIYPNGFTNSGNEMNNGTYSSNGINVTFHKNHFMSINPNSSLLYSIPTFGDSMFIFEIESSNRTTANANITINNGNGKQFNIVLGKDYNENTPYKIFVTIKDNQAKKLEFRNSVLFNQSSVHTINQSSQACIRFNCLANENFRIKQVIQLPYQEMENIDYLSNCQLVFKTPNDSLCYTVVANDSNGIPSIKTHANILKEKTGLRVNNSDNYNLNNSNVMLNTAGSKKIGDELTRLRNDINRVEGIANHSHPYMRDGGSYGTITLSNWIRTSGKTGWYNTTYGGKIYMQDYSWIRINKGTVTSGESLSTGELTSFYSDERLKKDFKEINNALEIIEQITPYEYKQSEFAENFGYPKTNESFLGFKANEVKKFLPSLVKKAPINEIINENEELKDLRGEDEFLTLDYSKFSVILWKAIQELNAKIKK